MKKRLSMSALFLGCLLATGGVALAHHGSRVSYDLTRTVTVKGTVKEFVYVNPHVYFTFEVKDEKGNVSDWAVETDPPLMMERNYQWNRRFLAPGDEVTVTLWPAKVGSPRGFLNKLVKADGTVTDHTQRPRD